MEIWRPIPEWQGYYSASSEGRIRRDAGSPRCAQHRVLNPMKTSYGYLSVGLVRSGVPQVPRMVHRLVLSAFAGPAPTEKHQGNHKNGIKTDNRPDNLEWATRSENVAHAYATGLHGRYIGSKASAAKLTEAQVADILSRLAAREYRQDLASEYGVSLKTLDDIVSGKNWAHVQRPDMAGKRMGRQVLTDAQVRQIKALLTQGLSCRAIGEMFGVSGPTIWHIKDGRTWAHIS